jgi:hypothetical protein
MLGACDFEFEESHYKNVNKNLYKPNSNSKGVYGGHAIMYSNKCAKYVLDIKSKNINFFDKNIKDIFNHFEKSYICYPNLICSDFSDTHLDHHFSTIDDNGEMYYNKCFVNLNFNDYHFICLKLFKYVNKEKFNKYITYTDIVTDFLNIYFNSNNEKIKNTIDKLDLNFLTIEDVKFISNIHTKTDEDEHEHEDEHEDQDKNINEGIIDNNFDNIILSGISLENIITEHKFDIDDIISNKIISDIISHIKTDDNIINTDIKTDDNIINTDIKTDDNIINTDIKTDDNINNIHIKIDDNINNTYIKIDDNIKSNKDIDINTSINNILNSVEENKQVNEIDVHSSKNKHKKKNKNKNKNKNNHKKNKIIQKITEINTTEINTTEIKDNNSNALEIREDNLTADAKTTDIIITKEITEEDKLNKDTSITDIIIAKEIDIDDSKINYDFLEQFLY